MKTAHPINSEEFFGLIIQGDSSSTIISLSKERKEIIIDQTVEDYETQTITIPFDDLLEALLGIDSQVIKSLEEEG